MGKFLQNVLGKEQPNLNCDVSLFVSIRGAGWKR
jgi:hypothetical protein